MADVLKLRGVRKSFAGKVCLDALDLSVEAGKVFGFLGPNGAGKTTTIRVILGLIVPEAGEVEVLGKDPRVSAAEVRALTGALLDHDGHYDRLTALQNLSFHAPGATGHVARLDGAHRYGLGRLEGDGFLADVGQRVPRRGSCPLGSVLGPASGPRPLPA